MVKTLSLVLIRLSVCCVLLGLISRSVIAQAISAAEAPKEILLDLGHNTTMKLARIPASKFLMGSPPSEKDRDPSEVQHEVTISKPFYMAVTPVTVAQFAEFIQQSHFRTTAETSTSATGNFDYLIVDGKLAFKAITGRSWRNPGYVQTPGDPVVEMTWNDCHEFCAWLTAKSGKTVKLPSEAQWEYACRAGTTTAYFWGDDPQAGKGFANLADQSWKKLQPAASPEMKFFEWDDGFTHTSPVASYKPNAFGLYDMTGNVAQWCEDKYADYAPEPVTDPLIAGIRGTRWVMRGGSFMSSPARTRSASRLGPNPSKHFFDFGFRVIVEGNESKSL